MALLKKMSSQRSSFPVSKFILIIFLSLGAIVYFDVTNHGSFKASSTGRFTKDIGIYPHVESAIKHSKIYFDRSYDWGVKNIPVYYKKTVEVSKPYLASFTEYSFIVYKQVQKALVVILAYAGEKLAFISQWVEVYAPDLVDRQLWSNIFDAIAHYSSIFLSLTLVFLTESFYFTFTAVQFAVEWLQKNVFVGNLSSENLQKYAIQGIDAAFSYAAKAFIWVQDKLVSIYA